MCKKFSLEFIRRIDEKPAREAHVHLPNGDVFPFNFGLCVIAAGAESGHIAHLAGMGIGDQRALQVPLPVEPRKRYVYNVHCPNGPGLDCPLVVDPTGTYFRYVRPYSFSNSWHS